MAQGVCTYPRCKCIVSTSTSQPDPTCPLGLPREVVRYVVTFVNKAGARTLAHPMQGRFTFASPEDAQAHLDAVIKNNSERTKHQVWGENPCFEVRPCPCWPGHFDPMTCWFDDEAAA